ncbi:BREX-1 system adenine-specific DNA-methyltransferase PglX, partial [Escherichia coli]
MNTSNIKKYAPVARKQFRDAVMQKLTTLGIDADKKGNLQIAQATDLGDSVRYGQFSLDKSLASRRERLVKRAEKQGYDVLVEHIAYTWFNRFCAIRYMELHGYLDHGFRMLSHPTLEGSFEVLDHVPEVADALGLDKSRLVEMKLAGDRDEELYRELLLAQCHALHGAMPFLFEAVNDDIELVLPDNLTRTDSILRGLVDTIPEEDWKQVEVIGWLYQFYISEKKDDVIGKVVKSEDIPAATQLFTPNWIVQYLVQNSVGRQWLQTYPDSSLKGKMPYYIEPAEQTPEVQAQLAAITPSSIEPESIKVLDPACGSGHILTEAYNVLKAIYEERGYRTRDIPQLILENNIFGLDIDDRAAQLSGFAMLMLARQDDRRILGRGVRLNIVSLQESKLDIAELWTKLNFHQQAQRGSMGDMFTQGTSLANTDSAEYKLLMRTLALFTSAKTLGSLIQVPQEDETALKTFLGGLYRLAVEGDIPQKEAAAELIPYIQQAWILAQRYDAVVANPPYMGGKGMNGELKEFAKKQFPDSKSDLFAMFIERGFSWLKDAAYNSMVTMQSWMFLSSYENMRANILDKYTIETMVHMGNGVMKIAFGTNATVFRNVHIPSYQGAFSYTENDDINDEGYPKEFPVKNDRLKTAAADDFQKIPGAPIAYWLSESEVNLFDNKKISQIASTRLGMATADNERFLRFWHEVNFANIGFDFTDRIQAKKSGLKWFPYQKGGEYRKWYGNLDYVVNWFDDGREIQNFTDEKSGKVRSHNYNLDFIFKKGITWNALSSSKTSARVSESSLFDNAGSSLFVNNEDLYLPVLAFINSDIIISLIKAISPTLNYQPGDISKLPAFFDEKMIESLSLNTAELISLAKENWSQQENSYQFSFNQDAFQNGSLVNILKNQTEVFYQKLIKTHELECDNNKIFYEKCNILNENNLAL